MKKNKYEKLIISYELIWKDYLEKPINRNGVKTLFILNYLFKIYLWNIYSEIFYLVWIFFFYSILLSSKNSPSNIISPDL